MIDPQIVPHLQFLLNKYREPCYQFFLYDGMGNKKIKVVKGLEPEGARSAILFKKRFKTPTSWRDILPVSVIRYELATIYNKGNNAFDHRDYYIADMKESITKLTTSKQCRRLELHEYRQITEAELEQARNYDGL